MAAVYNKLMQPVYIASVGMTKFGKLPNSLVELLCAAGSQALASAQTDLVEAVFIGAMNAEEFTGSGNIGSQTVEALGLPGVPAALPAWSRPARPLRRARTELMRSNGHHASRSSSPYLPSDLSGRTAGERFTGDNARYR